jgi:hypothetical protein
MWQAYSQHHAKQEKTETISSTVKIEKRVSTLSTFIQHSLVIPWQEEEIKWIQIGKEVVKLSLLADGMILYLKDPENSTKKLLDIRNTFSKIAGYKINLQKWVALLYINNEQRKNIGKQFHL